MGQSCSFAQQQQGHNPYRQGKSCHNNTDNGTRINLLQSYILNQNQSLDQVTLIQASQQLIYEFHNSNSAVVKLPVKSWQTQKQQIQQIEIEEFLADKMSFICRIKYCFQNYPVWKIVRVVKMQKDEELKEFAMLYFRFYQVRGIESDRKTYVFADKCFLQTNKPSTNNNHSSHSFIIQSQFSLSPFVPLRSLGFFMKLNHICWQDSEFLSIIKQSLNLISKVRKNGAFLFQEWLIDSNGQIFTIGTLVETLGQEKQLMYIKELVLYLSECLYGQKLTIVTTYQQLKATIEQKQKESKYKHSQSISALLKLYQKGIIQNDQKKTKDLKLIKPKIQQTPNIIHHYVESYRAKRRLIQSCTELAIVYDILGQNEKAREILYQKISMISYQLMGQRENGMNRDDKMRGLIGMGCDKLRKLNHKNIENHSTLHQLHSTISHLITLQRQLQPPSPYLPHLLNQYLHISLILSSSFRFQPSKSLTILIQVRQFLHQFQSWQLELHIAMYYFYTGDFQQAQMSLKLSIERSCNEGNLCFAIMFYTSVLNWQHAVYMLQQYQLLISSHPSLIDLMLSKILLSKSLCMSKSNDNQQRSDLLYSAINMASKILNHNKPSVPQIILLQAYQIIGDAYFYMKHYPTARQFYSKSMAICSAIQFITIKQQDTNSCSYQPVYMMRSSQLQYTRTKSISIQQSKYQDVNRNSILKRQQRILKTTKTTGNNRNQIGRFQESVCRTSIQRTQQQYMVETHNNPQSFLYQLHLLFNPTKRSVLLSSMANCYFMQQNYSQAIKFYKDAQSKLHSYCNKDLYNSIIGNLTLCEVQMMKTSKVNKLRNIKIESINECKRRLEKIIDETRDEYPEKLLNDVNYIFILNQLNSI